jgi:hypothetical protein
VNAADLERVIKLLGIPGSERAEGRDARLARSNVYAACAAAALEQLTMGQFEAHPRAPSLHAT